MQLATAKAVISGGASGLGFATAQRVIDAGGQVVLFDINDEQGSSSAAGLGDRASYIKTDVSDEGSVKAAVKQAAEAMNGITLAVNCAGILTAGRALGRDGPWPSELFNKVIQVNLVGSFNVTKEAAAVMQLNDVNEDGERGVIISTASIAAFGCLFGIERWRGRHDAATRARVRAVRHSRQYDSARRIPHTDGLGHAAGGAGLTRQACAVSATPRPTRRVRGGCRVHL